MSCWQIRHQPASTVHKKLVTESTAGQLLLWNNQPYNEDPSTGTSEEILYHAKSR
jgi:hypothetical protein